MKNHLHPSPKLAVLMLVAAFAITYFTTYSSKYSTRSRATEITAEQIATVPSEIASDCSVDVTTQLNDWIKTVPDNSILQFTAGTCYRIDETVEFANRNNLTIEGNGVTFKAITDGRETDNPRVRAHLSFPSGSNITVRNVIVRGANPYAGTGEAAYVAELEAQHGIQVHGTQDMTIDNVQIYDVYGDFVYIGPYRVTPQVLANNVTVKNSRLERNGRQGIAITGATNVLIENNTIAEVRRSTIDIEPNRVEDEVHFFTFRGNTVGAGRLPFFSNQGAAAPISDITVENNQVNREMSVNASTPSGPARSRYKFINNKAPVGIGNPSGFAFGFTRVDDIEVRGNTVAMQSNRGMHLVGLYSSSNVRVVDNIAPYAVASINFKDTGSTNYCVANNQIGNPLYIEYTLYTCPGYPTGIVPPTAAPDTIAPVVTITAPVDGATIKGKTTSISASATDNVKVSSLELYIDGTRVAIVPNGSSIAYSWYTQQLKRGSHTITVKAYDPTGNVGEKTITVKK